MSASRSRSRSEEPRSLKLGHYGTAAFKGGERFHTPRSTSPSVASASSYVDPNDISVRVKSPDRKGIAAFRYTAPRFPEPKPTATASADSYVPPGVAEEIAKTKHGVLSFKLTSERFPNANKGKLDVPPYDPPTMVDEILRSKHGVLSFKLTSERFQKPRKAATEAVYHPKGFAEEILSNKHGVLSFKLTSERFPKPNRSTPDVAPYEIPGIADLAAKNRGKGTFSKFTGERFSPPKKTASNDVDPYTPPGVGTPRPQCAANWVFKATAPRFGNTNRKLDTPFYDPPTFVDLILRK